MATHTPSSVLFLLLVATLIMNLTLQVKAQTCLPNGILTGTTPPLNTCDYDCCIAGQRYPIYKCSPAVSSRTKAILTLNSFEDGGDGGGPSECDNQYHSDSTLIVALSTGWYNKNSRCLKYITIYGNGRSVRAKVVDECDSTKGCDNEHGYQPPCRNNIVDGSSAVWTALGVPESYWGELDVYWSDA